MRSFSNVRASVSGFPFKEKNQKQKIVSSPDAPVAHPLEARLVFIAACLA